MIIFIALFMVSHTVLIFVSQYNYVNEIRKYYKDEIILYLDEGKQAANVRVESIVEDSNLQPVFEREAPLESERNPANGKEKEESDIAESEPHPMDPGVQ